MVDTLETIATVRVKAEQLPEDFEQSRLSAYETLDQTERQIMLTNLAASTLVRVGEEDQRLKDRAYDLGYDPDKKAAAGARHLSERAARVILGSKGVGGQGGHFFDIKVTPSGEIVDIFRVDILPEDIDATRRGERVVKRTPSGRKQNETSFRLSAKDVFRS
jgi:hypothetical protein